LSLSAGCSSITSATAKIENFSALARQTISKQSDLIQFVADFGNVYERNTMSSNGSKSSAKSTPMTNEAAARIQSHEAKANGGSVKAGTFPARAQRAATVNQGKTAGSK
jgi:hypothetical protein